MKSAGALTSNSSTGGDGTMQGEIKKAEGVLEKMKLLEVMKSNSLITQHGDAKAPHW